QHRLTVLARLRESTITQRDRVQPRRVPSRDADHLTWNRQRLLREQQSGRLLHAGRHAFHARNRLDATEQGAWRALEPGEHVAEALSFVKRRLRALQR